jgi:hypothetical protein
MDQASSGLSSEKWQLIHRVGAIALCFGNESARVAFFTLVKEQKK